MQTIPDDRLFTEEHEWIKINNDEALIGISHHAQSALGDVVYVELPEVGKSLKKGTAIGVVESVKAVSDIYAPLSGVVVAVNQNVIDHPEGINQDPYGEGWLLQIKLNNLEEKSHLLDAERYGEILCKENKC